MKEKPVDARRTLLRRQILWVSIFALAQLCALNTRIFADETTKTQINKVLIDQAGAWNNHNIDQFMESYHQSDQLSFSAGGTTLRGWQATRDRYKARYPDADSMGRLTFDNLEINQLGSDAAFVLGRWKLQRKTNSIGGNFTLVFRRINGAWLIVHDHTSLANAPNEQ